MISEKKTLNADIVIETRINVTTHLKLVGDVMCTVCSADIGVFIFLLWVWKLSFFSFKFDQLTLSGNRFEHPPNLEFLCIFW
jgi:hypothetical protein